MMDGMVERNTKEITRRLRVAKPWLCVEEHGVRSRDRDLGLLLPEQTFAVVLLWEAAQTGAGDWIGWLTTVSRRSACFCAADVHEAGFVAWLERLPRWEPARLSHAIEIPGLHLVWRRHLD
jgi:hypothetical protein